MLQLHISHETHPVTPPIMTRSLANRTQRPLSKASDDGTVPAMCYEYVDASSLPGAGCLGLR